MGIITVNVSKKMKKGKRFCKKMRYESKIPGIIYGEKKEVVAIEMSLEQALLVVKESIVQLKINEIQENVIIKDIQYNTFGDKLLHIDFQRIDFTQKSHFTIPIHFLGTPKGVLQGGILEKQVNKVNIVCLPTAIPQYIPLFIENLEIGTSIRIKDIKTEVQIDMDPELLVVAVHAQKTETPAEGTPEAEVKKVEPEVIRKKELEKEKEK
jgi:large subunit ribosomal protein L25